MSIRDSAEAAEATPVREPATQYTPGSEADFERLYQTSYGRILGTLTPPGTVLGPLRSWVASETGLVSVPVIASGGAKLPEHFAEIFAEGAADAALAASIFHDNVQSIRDLKKFLSARGIEVRLPC